MSMHAFPHPSPWVRRFASLIPQPGAGQVLDLACGSGRHARLLAALGHRVLAVDRDAEALAAVGEDIELLQADLENGSWPLAGKLFNGIVVTNYLHRPLVADLLAALAPGGILIYETFARGNEQFGKPSNPNFLLAPGELLTWMQREQARDLRVIAYEDGYLQSPKPAMVQRLCARREYDGQAPVLASLD